MFGKLKEKLKSWTKKVSEESEEKPEEVEDLNEEKKVSEASQKSAKKTQEKSKWKKKEKKSKEKKGSKKDDEEIEEILAKELEKAQSIEPGKTFDVAIEGFVPNAEMSAEKLKEVSSKTQKEKKSLFKKSKSLSAEEFDKHSEDLEMILIENNVALEVADKVIGDLKEKIVGKPFDKKNFEEEVKKGLREIIEEVLLPPIDVIKEIKEKKEPYVILFCGINGAGKTTTIAKFVNLLKKNKIDSVLAAGDTFRAASIEQLNEHGKMLDVLVISHEYGSDPASVGFDAIKYAKKNEIKAVLIDTAGRIHTAKNLLMEMQKIKRVTNPDRTIFLGESITGNDSVDQVKAFDETIGIDGIILSKADIDEKGGTALSVGYITKKPILYLGTGQNYEDLEPFDKKKFIEKLGLD